MVTRPSYSTEKRREYQRAYRASGRDNSRSQANKILPFVGIDGEGGNLENGYHAYFLLRVGQSSLVPASGNARLTTGECLDFLASLPRDVIYVGFFLDYDITKWLEDLPFSKLNKLIHRELRTRKDGKGVWPVDYGPYQFDYLPRKEFKVRKEIGSYIHPETGKEVHEFTPWIIINDVGSFFQTRFVEALAKWDIGTPEQREAIGIGKEARGTFQISELEQIAEYNALEIELLQQLMEKFRSACIQVGYVPAKWQGPGQLAESMLAAHGVPRSKEVPVLNDPEYTELIRFANNAFYGGRPEIMAVGPVDRPVSQWDINSAYPYAMLSVPCLIHGTWEYVSDDRARDALRSCRDRPMPDSSNPMGIFYGSFTSSPSNGKRLPFWYGLPTRSKGGTIVYPGAGRGWYWGFEIAAATHQVFVPESGWVYKRQCDCRPLSFVRDVYAERNRIGKDGPGIVLKLGLNSLYGKTVQSIGSPKFSNPIWGSFITAYCRTMIQEFIHSSPSCTDPNGWCGKDILMVATDSLCTWRERDDIDTGTGLGQWSQEIHPRGMLIVQPGLYFGSSSKPAKTRGVPRSVIETYEPLFRQRFADMVATKRLDSGDVDVPQRMYVGIRYAIHRRNLKLLGQWIEFEDPETGRTGKRISFDWSSKRAPWPVIDPMPGIHSYIETFPLEGDPTVESLPYSKDIGGLQLRTTLRELLEGQPDWVPIVEVGELSNDGNNSP